MDTKNPCVLMPLIENDLDLQRPSVYPHMYFKSSLDCYCLILCKHYVEHHLLYCVGYKQGEVPYMHNAEAGFLPLLPTAAMDVESTAIGKNSTDKGFRPPLDHLFTAPIRINFCLQHS